MTTSAFSRSVQSSIATGFKQSLRQTIDSTIKSNFAGTLGSEKDIVNIVMALCQRESSMRADAAGISLPLAKSYIARDYWNSPAITSALKAAGPQEYSNISEGLRAWGVMQVGGWNLVRGASQNGKTEIEVARPDLASQLLVKPADSISAKYNGEANVQNQVLAGLVMLESKYKAVKGSGISWKIGNFTFNSRITGAVAAYLGLGAKDVVTGITPQQYANSIVYGQSYQLANNGAAPSGNRYVTNANVAASQAGPAVTVASGNNQTPVGC